MTDSLHEVIGNPALNSQDLVLGAGPFPGNIIVSRAVARFIDTHPRVKIRLEIRNWDELLPRLRNQELDLFVAETSTLEGETDLAIETMARHPIYFLARPGHALAGQPALDMGRVFCNPIISPSRVPPRVLEPVLSAIAMRHASGGAPLGVLLTRSWISQTSPAAALPMAANDKSPVTQLIRRWLLRFVSQ